MCWVMRYGLVPENTGRVIFDTAASRQSAQNKLLKMQQSERWHHIRVDIISYNKAPSNGTVACDTEKYLIQLPQSGVTQ